MCTTSKQGCATTPVPVTPGQRLKHSYKRAKKLTGARNKNLQYYGQVADYLQNLPDILAMDAGRDTEIEKRLYIDKYRQRLITCASGGLYRRLVNGRECTLIAAHTCNHRLCTVCNMLRSRKLRHKWHKFLTDATPDVPIKKAQAPLFGIPVEMYEKDTYFTSGAEILQRFDLMHLTLTVPHEGGQWNGQEYYAQELLKKFNEMRKADWWVEMVFGGEYTVETTQNADGLHIHIHALLFVDKQVRGSRNILSENILRRWNYLTIDRNSSKAKVIDEDRAKSILDGYKYLDEDSGNNLVLDLDGRGATMIGISTLFYEISAEEFAARSSGVWEKNGKYFSRCMSSNTFNGTSDRTIKSILKGVVECLKYHFEPCAMEDDEGFLNMDLVAKILPNIYRQRLYGKFGGFYGVSQLNVMEEPLSVDDMMEEVADFEADSAAFAREAFDPRTGQQIDPTEYFYCIADAKAISFDADKDVYYLARSGIKHIISPHDSPNLRMAVKYLAHYSVKEH